MRQFTREEAIKIATSNLWEDLTPFQIVELQLFQDKLCMPFSIFCEAIEKVLDRSVFTHEFAYPDLLRAEFLKEKAAPTFEDICNLIPKEKMIILNL